uniref:CARD domain-containing protein n=1 Tax=Cyprinodon variegatus TaxID=28743 RepID=A0A3Q2DY28_CYPVA
MEGVSENVYVENSELNHGSPLWLLSTPKPLILQSTLLQRFRHWFRLLKDSVLVQPTEAEFDAESYDCLTLISVTLKSIIGDIELSLKEKSDSSCVWEGHVGLLPQRLKTGLTSEEQLKETRTQIIDKISEPVLHSLLDRLLGQKVLTDSESDFIRNQGTKSDKARVLVDTVKNKGDQASSEMIRFLCKLDPYFCRNVGLICEKPEPKQ